MSVLVFFLIIFGVGVFLLLLSIDIAVLSRTARGLIVVRFHALLVVGTVLCSLFLFVFLMLFNIIVVGLVGRRLRLHFPDLLPVIVRGVTTFATIRCLLWLVCCAFRRRHRRTLPLLLRNVRGILHDDKVAVDVDLDLLAVAQSLQALPAVHERQHVPQTVVELLRRQLGLPRVVGVAADGVHGAAVLTPHLHRVEAHRVRRVLDEDHNLHDTLHERALHNDVAALCERHEVVARELVAVLLGACALLFLALAGGHGVLVVLVVLLGLLLALAVVIVVIFFLIFGVLVLFGLLFLLGGALFRTLRLELQHGLRSVRLALRPQERPPPRHKQLDLVVHNPERHAGLVLDLHAHVAAVVAAHRRDLGDGAQVLLINVLVVEVVHVAAHAHLVTNAQPEGQDLVGALAWLKVAVVEAHRAVAVGQHGAHLARVQRRAVAPEGLDAVAHLELGVAHGRVLHGINQARHEAVLCEDLRLVHRQHPRAHLGRAHCVGWRLREHELVHEALPLAVARKVHHDGLRLFIKFDHVAHSVGRDALPALLRRHAQLDLHPAADAHLGALRHRQCAHVREVVLLMGARAEALLAEVVAGAALVAAVPVAWLERDLAALRAAAVLLLEVPEPALVVERLAVVALPVLAGVGNLDEREVALTPPVVRALVAAGPL
eukprot:PhM_4_TR2411/c1_g1_i1/m.74299